MTGQKGGIRIPLTKRQIHDVFRIKTMYSDNHRIYISHPSMKKKKKTNKTPPAPNTNPNTDTQEYVLLLETETVKLNSSPPTHRPIPRPATKHPHHTTPHHNPPSRKRKRVKTAPNPSKHPLPLPQLKRPQHPRAKCSVAQPQVPSTRHQHTSSMARPKRPTRQVLIRTKGARLSENDCETFMTIVGNCCIFFFSFWATILFWSSKQQTVGTSRLTRWLSRDRGIL